MKHLGVKLYFYITQVVIFILCTLNMVRSTSLMKRIREKQGADDAMKRGLDFETNIWMQVPQPVQDVLMSIDDKLRSLDTFSYTLKLARLDFSLDQLVRRMENIETKLGRLETKFDVRMEKIEEVVISKDIKEEFSNEHLSRGMENLNEKINNKAAYLDAKLDIKLERIMSKLELLERDLHNSVDDILERLIKNDERHSSFESEIIQRETKFQTYGNDVHELRLYVKEELPNLIAKKSEELEFRMDKLQDSFSVEVNKSQKDINELKNLTSSTKDKVALMVKENSNKIESLSANCNYVDRIRSLTDTCENSRSQTTQEQLNNLTIILEKALNMGEAKFKELDSDVELYTRKVINGIQELWKTSDELKSDLSHALQQGNKTREMVRQEFLRLHEQIEPLPKLEPKLSHISEDLDRKVVELSATVDNSFATLLVAQNSFIASCRRIQEEEMHIYDILQQVVYEMRNRSITDIDKINTELQTQSFQMQKSLSQVTDAVFATSNRTTDAMQSLMDELKQQNKCVLETENIDWRLIESMCHQISINVPSSVSRESVFITNLARTIDNKNNPIQEENKHLQETQLQSELTENQTNNTTNREPVVDDNPSFSSHDYKSDYPGDIDYED